MTVSVSCDSEQSTSNPAGRPGPKRGGRWWLKMLVASTALAGLLILLAWAAPGLRLYYYGLRYRMGWGREEALDSIRGQVVGRGVSQEALEGLLGPPHFAAKKGSDALCIYECGPLDNPWVFNRERQYYFESGRLVRVIPSPMTIAEFLRVGDQRNPNRLTATP